MLVVMYYDWFGTPEGLEEWKTSWKNACNEAKGVTSCKHYTPHQARYHYAWVMEVGQYSDVMDAMSKNKVPRDRNANTHTILEILSES